MEISGHQIFGKSLIQKENPNWLSTINNLSIPKGQLGFRSLLLLPLLLMVFLLLLLLSLSLLKNCETDFSVQQKKLAILFPVLPRKCTTEFFYSSFLCPLFCFPISFVALDNIYYRILHEMYTLNSIGCHGSGRKITAHKNRVTVN